MKNLKFKLLSFLENNNKINPNSCQINAASDIQDMVNNYNKIKIFKTPKLYQHGIYIYGSVGVGKSVLLKALSEIVPNSKFFHFNDLIFNLQSKNKSSSDQIKEIKKNNLIIIDEFFINNLTILILFKDFIDDFENLKIPIIMSGNKKLSEIYDDPINPKLCKNIREKLVNFFSTIQIKSKIDYREKNKVNQNFYFIGMQNNFFQKQLIKKLSSSITQTEELFKRQGNSFKLSKIYGNLIELKFDEFFAKNFVFQDYEIIAKRIQIFVVRNIIQMDENSKNLLARFISFIDVLYENKNILSISTNVELNKLYSGKTNANEFKRTISRLKEMGSDDYINKYL